jgi:hypothetical protein
MNIQKYLDGIELPSDPSIIYKTCKHINKIIKLHVKQIINKLLLN